jgi:hypothetical protein
MATLILGAVRAVGGSVAVTIYSTLINGVMKHDAGKVVGNAVVPLGYPAESLESLIVNLINENVDAAANLPGVTSAILQAARFALQNVWSKDFHKLYLAAASFSAISVLVAFLSEDVCHNMQTMSLLGLQMRKRGLNLSKKVRSNHDIYQDDTERRIYQCCYISLNCNI